MARFNSGVKYNVKKINGGGTYNSAPYIVIVYDSGISDDIIPSLLVNASVSDSGTGIDSSQLKVTLSPILDTGTGQEDISLSVNVNINDLTQGQDIVSLMYHMTLSDSGKGTDNINHVAQTFFFIDNGGEFKPLNVLVLKDSRYDTFPSLKEYVEEIPGRHGEIYFGSKLGSRLLELHVASTDGLTPEQKEEFKRLCAKYLNPLNGTKPLIFGDDIEKTYVVKYAGKIDPIQYANWMEFTIPFKMTNPYIIGTFEKKHSGNGILTNAGNTETPLLIEIQGNITNPSIIIGGQIVTYTGTIAAGKKLIIDTEKITAELDGVDVIENLVGELPIMLQPGNTSVTADSKVTFIWKDRWV